MPPEQDDNFDSLFSAGADDIGLDDMNTPPAEPPAEDPPAEDPPAEDPPAEDPPAEPPAEDPPADDNVGQIMIPKARFDEVNQRRRLAEERIKELENQAAKPAGSPDTPTAEAYDFDKREADYLEAVLDGDQEKAASIRREIRAEERKTYEAAAKSAAEEARTGAVTDIDLGKTIAQVEADYPVFDNKSEQFDDLLTEEVLDLQSLYIERRNMDPAAALRKAADYVARANGVTKLGDEPPPAQDPAPADPPKPSPGQVQRKVEAADRQPPAAKPTARPEPSIDLANMTDEEFDNLPAETLRQLRGDYRTAS